jgi:hypothetical protein
LHLNYTVWWFGTCFIFPYIGNIIIPTDELIFFRVGQPQTSINGWYNHNEITQAPVRIGPLIDELFAYDGPLGCSSVSGVDAKEVPLGPGCPGDCCWCCDLT